MKVCQVDCILSHLIVRIPGKSNEKNVLSVHKILAFTVVVQPLQNKNISLIMLAYIVMIVVKPLQNYNTDLKQLKGFTK